MATATRPSSAFHATLPVVPTPSPLSLRLGRTGLQALEDLARLRGVTKAEAARQAIEETAQRELKRGGLAAEAQRLMEDPEYVAEARELAELLEDISGSW